MGHFADYEFGEFTSWSTPSIESWERDAPQARINFDHPLFAKTLEYTDKLIERGHGHFIVGLTDFHPGGDHLVALRDPEQLAIDLLDNPQWVKAMANTTSSVSSPPASRCRSSTYCSRIFGPKVSLWLMWMVCTTRKRPMPCSAALSAGGR